MGDFTENFKRIQQIKNTNFESEAAQLFWKRQLAELLLKTGRVTMKDIEEDNLKLSDGEGVNEGVNLNNEGVNDER